MIIPRFKNFSIFKAKPNENEKLPTHALSMKMGDEYIVIGGAWTKESTTGKYLSAKLSDAYVNTQDIKKSRKSFVIVLEEDLIKLEELLDGKADHTAIDPTSGKDLNAGDIPF